MIIISCVMWLSFDWMAEPEVSEENAVKTVTTINHHLNLNLYVTITTITVLGNHSFSMKSFPTLIWYKYHKDLYIIIVHQVRLVSTRIEMWYLKRNIYTWNHLFYFLFISRKMQDVCIPLSTPHHHHHSSATSSSSNSFSFSYNVYTISYFGKSWITSTMLCSTLLCSAPIYDWNNIIRCFLYTKGRSMKNITTPALLYSQKYNHLCILYTNVSTYTWNDRIINRVWRHKWKGNLWEQYILYSLDCVLIDVLREKKEIWFRQLCSELYGTHSTIISIVIMNNTDGRK